VLVPVIDRPQPMLLLTRHHDRLSMHAGQIAFPGGKLDDGDADAAACALREAAEEIGLDRRLVEPIGFLPPYVTGSGFRVAPLLARVDTPYQITLNENEVSLAFEVPLSFLMNPANHRRRSRTTEGVRHRHYEIRVAGHTIWGATAGIIRSLYNALERR
jgi:8-oxo-dGTP pyrophosphatase MutT (NUDIX family)